MVLRQAFQNAAEWFNWTRPNESVHVTMLMEERISAEFVNLSGQLWLNVQLSEHVMNWSSR